MAPRSHLELIYSEPAYREHVRLTDPDDAALRQWEAPPVTGYRLAPVIILDDPPGEPHPDDDNEELRAWYEAHFSGRSAPPFETGAT